MADFEDDVVAVLRGLKKGDVVTYGEVAAEAGRPGAARAVGNILAMSGDGLPWWRVVRADGRLASPNRREQAKRLKAEGVPIRNGRVVHTGGPGPLGR
jgi:methylated-DNA-protein-cysteine methyltransferase-like protein